MTTPKIEKPNPPPLPPTKADASVVQAGQEEMRRYASLISPNEGELKRKASVKKASLIGGA